MSIQSWKKQFFKQPMPKGALAATKHSLRKWTGLLPKNLQRHGLETCSSGVLDIQGYVFAIDSSNCALCETFQTRGCPLCPILKVTGSRCVDYKGPWKAWIDNQDPEPMIATLKVTLEGLQNNRKKKEPKIVLTRKYGKVTINQAKSIISSIKKLIEEKSGELTKLKEDLHEQGIEV